MKFIRQNYEAILLLIFAWAILVIVGLTPGCAHVSHGPAVDVCVTDVSDLSMHCADKFGQNYVTPYIQAEGWVCMPPNDFEAMINFYKNGTYPTQKAAESK